MAGKQPAWIFLGYLAAPAPALPPPPPPSNPPLTHPGIFSWSALLFFMGPLLQIKTSSHLAILHSLTQGRLSYSSSMLLLLPPSPLLLHLLILYRKLQGEEHHR